ncbi:MAG: deoxyribodipyrimidine photo-lyase [Rhodobacteraceae bacterium]|nr:deoxyribodipyrimidine photo-lyase [Paracoccaceae bacterium]
MLSLVWFRRDLRVDDHPALSRAAAEGPVLPVYIADPEEWAQGDLAARHLAFLDESIRSLREDLAQCGQPLILRTGDAVEVLTRLHAKHRFTRIVTHPETGDGGARARFARVAGWACGHGLGWLVTGAEPSALLPPPVLRPVTEATGALPGLRALELAEDRCPYRQPGGGRAARDLLDSWLASRGENHALRQVTTLAAERSGTRLSPHLAFGVISSRRVREAMAARVGQPGWATPLRGLGQTLALRDAAHAAAPAPALSGRADCGPWALGETGLPIVDASMRALAARGWACGPSRALLAGVGIQLLRLSPAAVGLRLAQLSTDHDPAILWREIGRIAGSRVPDPVAAGQRLDPDATFLRRWLPELAPVPDAFVHAPWLWPAARSALAGRYPEPVIDPRSAAREARARRVRQAPPRPRDPTALLVEPPLRARPQGPQMLLDL